MLPALAWAVASSSLLYVITPRMPLYQVTSLKLVTASFSSLFSFELSANIRAGVQIQNENFVGADVHAAIVDIFYPDWNGALDHIGVLRDANDEKPLFINTDTGTCEDGAAAARLDGVDPVEDAALHEQCVASPPMSSRVNASEPFFTVHARRASSSHDDLLSIDLQRIKPRTYLRMLSDIVETRGKLVIPTAGVAHVKSTMALVPLTIGLFCDNTLDLLSNPVKIVGRECSVESLATGWSHISQHVRKLRAEAIRRHNDTGTVLDQRKGGDNEEKAGRQQFVVDWHDF